MRSLAFDFKARREIYLHFLGIEQVFNAVLVGAIVMPGSACINNLQAHTSPAFDVLSGYCLVIKR
ncbi:MAG: hypothetical protein ACI9ES_002748 [Oceanospirillaceae bacterium]